MDYYKYLMEEIADPRTKNWFLVHSPLPTAIILFSYCYFVFICGPKFMKDKKPYSLKTFIKFYNIFQIVTNSLLLYGTLTSGWLTSFSLGCEPLNTSPTGEGYRMAAVTWWTFMLKLIDLCETGMYTLRKKNNQISFLHVYHHISTVLIAWMGVKWFPGGMLSLTILINSAVHVIMYSYYLLSTGSPGLQKIAQMLKPRITIIQMLQFCILELHSLQGLRPSCPVSKPVCMLLVVNLFINLCLFYNFYRKNYIRKKNDLKNK